MLRVGLSAAKPNDCRFKQDGCHGSSTRRAWFELVATIAAYNMVSRFLVALRIEH